MQMEDDKECFAFPIHLESHTLHADLFALPTVKVAKRWLTTRNMVTKPWVVLPKELAQKYLDEEGNPVFEGLMLESAPPYISQTLITRPAQPTDESKSLVSLLRRSSIESDAGQITAPLKITSGRLSQTGA